MILDIPQDLIDDLVNCPGDESNHLHIGYWILDNLNFPSNKEIKDGDKVGKYIACVPRYTKLLPIKRKRNGKTINK